MLLSMILRVHSRLICCELAHCCGAVMINYKTSVWHCGSFIYQVTWLSFQYFTHSFCALLHAYASRLSPPSHTHTLWVYFISQKRNKVKTNKAFYPSLFKDEHLMNPRPQWLLRDFPLLCECDAYVLFGDVLMFYRIWNDSGWILMKLIDIPWIVIHNNNLFKLKTQHQLMISFLH